MEKLLHTLEMDKVYEGYRIYLYECKTPEGLTYYRSKTNELYSGWVYETKKEMLDFYNEWLEELGEDYRI
jgi:hypothetical protein